MYPNPTNGLINLERMPESLGAHGYIAQVIHADGKVAFTKANPIEDDDLEIDLKELVPGTYFLKIKWVNNKGTILVEEFHKILFH